MLIINILKTVHFLFQIFRHEVVGWLIGPLVHCSVCPHDEILRNLLTSKTGYVAIASRLGFGVTSLFNKGFMKVNSENMVSVIL
jgi:hypothetical protein